MQIPKPSYPQRKHNPLEGFDYSLAGAYFVTICTHDHRCLFGDIHDGEMQLSAFGKIVQEEWLHTGQMRPSIFLDHFVVMPNHLHGIIAIDYPWLGYRRPQVAKHSLERIVAGFKAACTRRINEARSVGEDCISRDRHAHSFAVWQKSFHDEIIRDEAHMGNVRVYIANNPAQWEFDRENPDLLRSA